MFTHSKSKEGQIHSKHWAQSWIAAFFKVAFKYQKPKKCFSPFLLNWFEKLDYSQNINQKKNEYFKMDLTIHLVTMSYCRQKGDENNSWINSIKKLYDNINKILYKVSK